MRRMERLRKDRIDADDRTPLRRVPSCRTLWARCADRVDFQDHSGGSYHRSFHRLNQACSVGCGFLTVTLGKKIPWRVMARRDRKVIGLIRVKSLKII